MQTESPVDDMTGVVPDDAPAIRAIVARLSRPHPSGGDVIERAAIMAEGPRSKAILNWIDAHAGKAEELAVEAASGGLHGARLASGSGTEAPTPRRYVLPAGAL
jgi:hypothetical protein